MGTVVRTRFATADDAAFLAEMLAEAAAWQPEATASVTDVLASPFFAHYVDDWPRPSDCGVIALEASGRVGAAWYRFFTNADPGFGFVAPDIPELSIAVVPRQRGRGIGRLLLEELLEEARTRGCTAVSLSVETENPARHLYEALGFRSITSTGRAWTMVRSIGSE